jgi:hypothetical protein
MTFACVSLNLACRLVPTFPKADQPSLYLGAAYWRKVVAAFGESCRRCGHVLASLSDPKATSRTSLGLDVSFANDAAVFLVLIAEVNAEITAASTHRIEPNGTKFRPNLRVPQRNCQPT